MLRVGLISAYLLAIVAANLSVAEWGRRQRSTTPSSSSASTSPAEMPARPLARSPDPQHGTLIAAGSLLSYVLGVWLGSGPDVGQGRLRPDGGVRSSGCRGRGRLPLAARPPLVRARQPVQSRGRGRGLARVRRAVAVRLRLHARVHALRREGGRGRGVVVRTGERSRWTCMARAQPGGLSVPKRAPDDGRTRS